MNIWPCCLEDFTLAWAKNPSQSQKYACIHKTTMEVFNLKGKKHLILPIPQGIGFNIAEWTEE